MALCILMKEGVNKQVGGLRPVNQCGYIWVIRILSKGLFLIMCANYGSSTLCKSGNNEL